LDGQATPRSCICCHPIKQQVRGQMPGSAGVIEIRNSNYESKFSSQKDQVTNDTCLNGSESDSTVVYAR
jgi:hypothetical protein